LILSLDKTGFLIDAGSERVLQELRQLRSAGKLGAVKNVFVTHYHDDHTDSLAVFAREFGATIHACGSLVDVIEHPGDYRLPCLTENPAVVTAKHKHLDTWSWNEFEMTIFDHPGQTLHHNALLVRRAGERPVFFAGDSFTPSGIDDYCLQNRNFLYEGCGYLRWLEQLRTLPQDSVVINQHVGPAFRFNPSQLSMMRATLHERATLLKELLPFDDPNFGLDASWAAIHPYWSTLHSGQSAKIKVWITNHSPLPQVFSLRLNGHGDMKLSMSGILRVPSRADAAYEAVIPVPPESNPGLHFITADIAWGGNELREWAECILEVVKP